MIGSARHARTVTIGQHVLDSHDLRMLQFFAPDLSSGGFIDTILRDQERSEADAESENQRLAHIAIGYRVMSAAVGWSAAFVRS
jgi:hypothetical protein